MCKSMFWGGPHTSPRAHNCQFCEHHAILHTRKRHNRITNKDT